MNSPDRKCPECGAELAPHVPPGVCPQCLLRRGLPSQANDLDSTVVFNKSEAASGESAKASGRATVEGLRPDTLHDAARTDALTPSRFGDYALLEEIARGGMGVVYKARQVSLDRIVALKMILSGAFATKEFVQRFRTEASAAAVLQHPNIVAIHEVGLHEGQHYFSMDYVEGQNLAQLIGARPVSPKRAAQYARTLAQAIHFAHERGILHRDLKPSNVLIDAEDQPKITDFGLAKRLSGSTELTVTGQVLGSPHFMPPEQARGDKVGRFIDVYALGAILYHLLTARPPFQGETLETVLRQVISDEPVRPCLLNGSVPLDLETICLKCLEKEPARRYVSAQALADELSRFLSDQPIVARSVGQAERSWRWCRRNPIVAGFAGAFFMAILLGSVGVMWQWRRAEFNADAQARERSRAEQNLYFANINLAQADWENGNIKRLRRLLDQTEGSPERGFEWYYWQRMCHLELMTLRGHLKAALSVAFSPDGKRIVSGSSDATAKVWDAATEKELFTLSGHKGGVGVVAFSPDGTRILTGSGDGTVRVWEAATGRELLVLPGGSKFVGPSSAAFSPDGHRIVMSTMDEGAGVFEVATRRRLLRLGPYKDSAIPVWNRVTIAVAFSPDGRFIVTGHRSEAANVWDARTGSEIRSLIGHGSGIASVAFSPDGTRIVTGSNDNTAKVWDTATGREMFTLRGHTEEVGKVAFSADGKRIATGMADGSVKVWNPETGGELLSFKGHTNSVHCVRFSWNGARVLTANIDDTAKVWETSNGRELLAFQNISQAAVAISLDGTRIVTGAQTNETSIRDATSGRELLVLRGHTGREISAVAFSTDGNRVITGDFDGIAKVWDVAAGRELVSLEGHTGWISSVAFSPDGRRIVTGSDDTTARVWDAATGRETLTLNGHEDTVYAVFSPDGRRIITGSSDHTARVWEAASPEQVAAWEAEERTGSNSLSSLRSPTRK